MASWKKVIVSGSSISQLDNDAGYIASVGGGILSSSVEGDAQGQIKLNGVNIDANALGTGDSPTFATVTADLTGTASIATKLATPRAFTTTGDVVITSTNFDGSANFTAAATIQAGSVENTMFAANAKTAISGAFTSTSSSIAADIASLQGAVGSGGTLISSSVEGDAQGQIKFNGVNVDANNLGTGDSPTFDNLILTGDLFVNGDITNVNTTNLNVEDKFILLASGSSTAAGDAGIIIEQSAVGVGSAFGWDQSEGRFGFDADGANAATNTVTFDAYAAAVVTTGSAAYAKAGNISIDGGDIFIYVP